MTSLYATPASASLSSEVSSHSSNSSRPHPRLTSDSQQPPLAEEAFLTSSNDMDDSEQPGVGEEDEDAATTSENQQQQPLQSTYANPLRFLYL